MIWRGTTGAAGDSAACSLHLRLRGGGPVIGSSTDAGGGPCSMLPLVFEPNENQVGRQWAWYQGLARRSRRSQRKQRKARAERAKRLAAGPVSRPSSIHLHSLAYHLHSLAFWATPGIFLLTPSDYKPSIPSTRPLEHTPAVPGPVVHFLWSCEVAEHGLMGPHHTAVRQRRAASQRVMFSTFP